MTNPTFVQRENVIEVIEVTRVIHLVNVVEVLGLNPLVSEDTHWRVVNQWVAKINKWLRDQGIAASVNHAPEVTELSSTTRSLLADHAAHEQHTQHLAEHIQHLAERVEARAEAGL